jgi:predicted nucleic acid-binding protein
MSRRSSRGCGVAALTDTGTEGRWAEGLLAAHSLAAPHLLPVEVASVLRRLARTEAISDDVAALAQFDLLDLPIALFPYEPHAERIWALRENLSTYGAWYVALAEGLSAPLATLDRRLARTPGVDCSLELPPRGVAPEAAP